MEAPDIAPCSWMPRLGDLQLSQLALPLPKAAIKQALHEESLLMYAGEAIERLGPSHPESVQAYLQFRAASGKAAGLYASSISRKMHPTQQAKLQLPLTALPSSPLQLLGNPATASWAAGSQMVQSHPGNQLVALHLYAASLMDIKPRSMLPEILNGAGVVSGIEQILLDTRQYMGTGVYYKDYIALRLAGPLASEDHRLSADAARWLTPITLAITWAASTSLHPAILIPWQRSLLAGLLSDHAAVATRGVVHSCKQVKVVVSEGRPVMLIKHSILDRLARCLGIRSYPAKANPADALPMVSGF